MAGSLHRKTPDSTESRRTAKTAYTAQQPVELAIAETKPGMSKRHPQELREVMDIRQASEYLGISPDSLYKYASESLIPAFKLGNRWRFKRSLLDRWMEQQSLAGPVAIPERKVRPRQKKPVSRAH